MQCSGTFSPKHIRPRIEPTASFEHTGQTGQTGQIEPVDNAAQQSNPPTGANPGDPAPPAFTTPATGVAPAESAGEQSPTAQPVAPHALTTALQHDRPSFLHDATFAALQEETQPPPQQRTLTHNQRPSPNPQDGGRASDSEEFPGAPAAGPKARSRSVGHVPAGGAPVAERVRPPLLEDDRASQASLRVVNVVPEHAYTQAPAWMYSTWAGSASAYGLGTGRVLNDAANQWTANIAYPCMLLHGVAEAYNVYRQDQNDSAAKAADALELTKRTSLNQQFLAADAAVKLENRALAADPGLKIDNRAQPPTSRQAAAALNYNALTTRIAHAALSGWASTILKVRDLWLQVVATATKTAGYVVTVIGATSTGLGITNGVLGLFAGALHIAQGGVERARGARAKRALQQFQKHVADARGRDGAAVMDKLRALDRTTITKVYPAERSFQKLLNDMVARRQQREFASVAKLAAVVGDRLQQNTARSITAATRQVRHAWVRIGYGVLSGGASGLLTGLAAMGTGGALPLIGTLGLVGCAVVWLVVAARRLRQAHREKEAADASPMTATPAERDIIMGLAARPADELELELELTAENQSKLNRFHTSVLLAKYLSLSSKDELSKTDSDAAYAARIRAKVVTRLLRLAEFSPEHIRALRALCQDRDRQWFVLAVEIIHSHVFGSKALEKRVAAVPHVARAQAPAAPELQGAAPAQAVA